LLKNLVLMNLKLKYRDSVFGFLWSLANPLLLIAVYSLAFKYILKVPTPNYAFFLLIGILPWVFFANALTMATGCIVDNANLIKKVFFPRLIIPVAAVLFNFIQYLLTFLVFLAAMFLLFRIAPTWPMLLFGVFLGLQTIFTVGLGMLLAIGTVFFRDIRHFVEVLLLLLFWLTPIIYEYPALPASLQALVGLSPLAPFVIAYQQVFYYAHIPPPALWLQACLYAVVAFAAGYAVFQRYAPRLAEEV